MDNE
jgi:uncharacterized membrane protein (UPF0136 family)